MFTVALTAAATRSIGTSIGAHVTCPTVASMALLTPNPLLVTPALLALAALGFHGLGRRASSSPPRYCQHVEPASIHPLAAAPPQDYGWDRVGHDAKMVVGAAIGQSPSDLG